MEKVKGKGPLMIRWWFILLPFIIFSPAQAEEKLAIEEVVVTATRYGEKATDVPANITVVSEEDIKNSTAQNIPELLKTEVGIHVNDITGNHRSFSVDLRGFGETSSLNTLVLVDGRRVNQPDLSGVDWAEIPLERVKRIEIVRGGRGSVIYGDNATGGVINIITKDGDAGFKTGLELISGSYGAFKAGSYISGSLNNLSLNLSGNYLTADGYRDNSGTESKDVGMRAAYYLKDFMRIDLSAGYHKDNTGLPGALKESDFASGASRTDSKFPEDFVEVEDYYLKFTPEVYFFGESTFKIDTSFRKRTFLSYSSGAWGNFLGDSQIETTSLSPQLILKNNFEKIKNSLTAGFDYQTADNGILNDSLFWSSRSLGNYDLKRKNYGYYLHDEIDVADTLRLSGGYRHDSVRFNFNPGSSRRMPMSKDVYTAGINYTFFKRSYAYLSYSRSFRYPLLDELYSFFTNAINTGLVPQTSDDYEAGIRHYFNDDFYAHLNVFSLDTDKEIFFNPAAYQNENLDGLTRREGIELSFDAKAASWLRLKGTYTFLSAQIKGGEFRGKDVPNVPKHKAAMEAISQMGKGTTLALTGTYIGERPFVSDFANDFSNQKAYLVLNVKYKYQWKSLKVFVDINNLTNREYSEYGVIGGFPLEKAFYPSPGRNFLVGLAIDF